MHRSDTVLFAVERVVHGSHGNVKLIHVDFSRTISIECLEHFTDLMKMTVTNGGQHEGAGLESRKSVRILPCEANQPVPIAH